MKNSARSDEIIQQEIERFGYMCPLCKEHGVEVVHHIVPRSRTSRKHEPPWLWDKRNLIALCNLCHVNDRPTRVRCVAVMMKRHPDWDYNVEPWREYAEENTGGQSSA